MADTTYAPGAVFTCELQIEEENRTVVLRALSLAELDRLVDNFLDFGIEPDPASMP